MSLFKSLFGSIDQQVELNKLKHRVQETPRTVVEYGIIAREVLAAKAKKGFLEGVEKEVLREILADWEERLRNMTLMRALEELERLGKLEELERALGHGIDQDAFFSYAIPNYPTWIRRTLEEAKRRL